MLTYPEIDPIIFSIGPLAIRWYGLMYVLGFVAAWVLARKRSEQSWSIIRKEQVDDLIFYAMLGVILGGRLGYSIFYGFEYWLQDPSVRVQDYTRRHVVSRWSAWRPDSDVDLRAPCSWRRGCGKLLILLHLLVPIGLGTGRIGNFINGELWGKPTDLPWAFNINGVGVHPSQLYEALFEGLILFIILWLFSAKQRPYLAVSGMFLFCYGVMRFCIEFVRVPGLRISATSPWDGLRWDRF